MKEIQSFERHFLNFHNFFLFWLWASVMMNRIFVLPPIQSFGPTISRLQEAVPLICAPRRWHTMACSRSRWGGGIAGGEAAAGLQLGKRRTEWEDCCTIQPPSYRNRFCFKNHMPVRATHFQSMPLVTCSFYFCTGILKEWILVL